MNEDELRELARQDVAQRNRSNGMIGFGVLLFLFAGYGASTSPDGTSAGVLVFGMLAVGLIVGGLVIRR